MIYRSTYHKDKFCNLKVITDLYEFKKMSDVIVTNRLSEDLKYVKDKVYICDVFNSDS